MEMAIEEQRTQIRELTRLSHVLMEKNQLQKSSLKVAKDIAAPSATPKEVSNVMRQQDGGVMLAINDVVDLLRGEDDDDILSPWSARVEEDEDASTATYHPGSVMTAVQHFLDVCEGR